MKKLLSIALLSAALAGCSNNGQIPVKDVDLKVNETVSKAEWKGSAPDHFHVGSFKVTGSLTATADGLVKTGDFIIPIASIQDFDLPDPVRQTLLTDLRDNFFKLAANPNAEFHITGIQAHVDDTEAADTTVVKGSNYVVNGNFVMLGKSQAISFPAKITAKGDSLITEAKFSINRTRWGMNNYNDPAQKLYIHPDVDIHLLVRAGSKK